MTMFEKEQFVEECRAALADSDVHGAMNAVVKKAVSEPGQVMGALGEPQRAGADTIYRAPDLTILNILWGPHMEIHPHNHLMWAVIGIYCGREDNKFYRRSEDGLTQHGVKVLDTKDTAPLGETIIHSVSNPLDKITGAIHVYGGDFFATPRSEWDAKTYEEHPYDVEHTMRLFEESNERLREAARE
jgi:predicted metal-dependent enzyme (double-stranded beta helix superfamily)